MTNDFKPNQDIICLDFNGVLDTYQGWRGKDYRYPPRKGVEQFLRSLLDRNYRLVILTAMDPQDVWDWLEKYNLDRYISNVTDRKIPALIYVDDRGLKFEGDFDVTLQAIDQFEVHWGGNT